MCYIKCIGDKKKKQAYVLEHITKIRCFFFFLQGQIMQWLELLVFLKLYRTLLILKEIILAL